MIDRPNRYAARLNHVSRGARGLRFGPYICQSAPSAPFANVTSAMFAVVMLGNVT